MNNYTKYEIPDDASSLGHGPDWLKEKRTISKTKYNNLDLPIRALHLWRYTDPSRLLTLTKDEPTISSSSLARPVKQPGLTVIPLSEAINSHVELIQKHLYSQVNETTGKFEAMNGALWSDGLLVHIASGVNIEEPINLVHTAPENGGQVYQRVLIISEANSKATIIDEYSGGSNDPNNQSGTNSVVEMICEQNSDLKYINFQNHSLAHQSFVTCRASLARAARIETISLTLGGNLSKANIGSRLDGAGADSNIYGFTLGSGRQHFDNHTKQHHRHGETTSDIHFKVVVRDKAESACTGLIRIEQSAANCEAYQINRNLILSDKAKAEAIPELEILNEEVSCSHGATMGEIDPEQIFYLNSRGVNNEEAIQIIVEGFSASIIDRLPAPLHEQVKNIIKEKLEII